MFPINEFILWNNCPNNCEFCWLKKEKQQTYNEQLESIDLVYDIVKDLKDTHTLFVGGEIFAETDKLIKEKLLNLYDLTFKRMLDGYLDLCYFNTNILYQNCQKVNELEGLHIFTLYLWYIENFGLYVMI